jgi:hypothetical protein
MFFRSRHRGRQLGRPYFSLGLTSLLLWVFRAATLTDVSHLNYSIPVPPVLLGGDIVRRVSSFVTAGFHARVQLGARERGGSATRSSD